MTHPTLIQGGMGIAVSHWRLARRVSQAGGLGVVSGTALSTVLVRRLQQGDPQGEVRRALQAFPRQEWVAPILADYFVEGGLPEGQRYALVGLPSLQPSFAQEVLTVVACFVEVYLAKEGHAGKVGINLLEKIQMPTLPSLYGAMLAGVDYVLMGAGIPRQIPRVLEGFARGERVELRIDVEGLRAEECPRLAFDPACLGAPVPLHRPQFLAVVGSATLALTLAKKAEGQVNGFVVELPAAGGHNAPPRGGGARDARGQPVYGPRDYPDLARFRELGLPFWLAGGQATPEAVAEARAQGAVGVQVGTAFAFCADSGLTPELKEEILGAVREGKAGLFTDPLASPTGFPFKCAEWPTQGVGQLTLENRARICDVGLLRRPFARPDGSIGYRCPAEPERDFVRKGGETAETVGRRCLCNGLLAAVGLGQVRPEGIEPPLVTAGEDLLALGRFLTSEGAAYPATAVVESLGLAPTQG